MLAKRSIKHKKESIQIQFVLFELKHLVPKVA